MQVTRASKASCRQATVGTLAAAAFAIATLPAGAQAELVTPRVVKAQAPRVVKPQVVSPRPAPLSAPAMPPASPAPQQAPPAATQHEAPQADDSPEASPSSGSADGPSTESGIDEETIWLYAGLWGRSEMTRQQRWDFVSALSSDQLGQLRQIVGAQDAAAGQGPTSQSSDPGSESAGLEPSPTGADDDWINSLVDLFVGGDSGIPDLDQALLKAD